MKTIRRTINICMKNSLFLLQKFMVEAFKFYPWIVEDLYFIIVLILLQAIINFLICRILCFWSTDTMRIVVYYLDLSEKHFEFFGTSFSTSLISFKCHYYRNKFDIISCFSFDNIRAIIFINYIRKWILS